MNPAAPSPLLAASMSSYVSGVSSAGREERVGDPDSTALTAVHQARTATDLVDDLRSGVPSAPHPDAGALGPPIDRADDRARRLAVPRARNQSGPLAMMPGTLAMVSTLLASVGGARVAAGPAISTAAADPSPSPELVGAMAERWGRPRKAAALHHLEQAGLLAEQVLLRAEEHLDRDAGRSISPP